jgi:hypothetical protein
MISTGCAVARAHPSRGPALRPGVNNKGNENLRVIYEDASGAQITDWTSHVATEPVAHCDSRRTGLAICTKSNGEGGIRTPPLTVPSVPERHDTRIYGGERSRASPSGGP